MPVIDEDADVGYWRARAGRAEVRVAGLEAAAAALRADKAGLNARVAELAGQVARLQESVTTLSGLLFGSLSDRVAAAPLPAAVLSSGARDGLRAAGGQAGAGGPVHRGVPGAAGV